MLRTTFAPRLALGVLRIAAFAAPAYRAFERPGSDLLSHALRHSTIGAEGLNGRVRNGIGCVPLAITTRPFKRTNPDRDAYRKRGMLPRKVS